MDYTEARAAFFTAHEGELRPLKWTSPARRLRDAIEPLATICFWSEPAYDAYAARGLDFLQGYVWGRASALGEPEPAVAAAAFGVFEPGLIEGVYAAGRAICSVTDIRAAKVEGVATALRTVLGDPADAARLNDTVAALRTSAEVMPTLGRPFFAGWRSLPWPTDGWAQLWHACTLLRELRGDGHLAALVAHDLDGVQANILTELWVGWAPLSYTGSRAWSPEVMAAATAALQQRGLISGDGLTDAGVELRERIEAATDVSVAQAIAALGDDLDNLITRLDAWAQQVVEHGWFPPDPYKRASG